MGLLLAGIVAGAVYFVHDSRQRALAQSDELVVTEIATRLQTFLETRLAVGRHIARDLRAHRNAGAYMADLRDYFAIEADSFLELYPDLQALNWVSADGVIADVNPESGNEDAIGLNVAQHPVAGGVLRAARRSGTTHLSEPIALAQGGTGVVAYTPVTAEGTLLGYVNLVFRVAPLIDSALPGDLRASYDLDIVDAGEPLLSTGAMPGEAAAVEDEVAAGGRTWQIRLAPRADLAVARGSVPELVMLVLGLAAAATIAGLMRLALRRGDELAASERRFRDYSEVSSDFFWETDAELRITFISERYRELTGRESVGVLGQTVNDRPPSAPPLTADEARYRADLEARRPFRDFVYARTDAQGRQIWLSISGKPMFDATDGRFAGYRGTGRDVTSDVAELEDMRRLRREADQASRAKSTFLAHMSHDLRTPLNSIIGFSSILEEKMFGPLGDPHYDEYVGYIRGSGEVLLELVNDILDLSRIESDEYTLDEEWIELPDFLGPMQDRYAMLLQQQEGRITLDEAPADARVLADRRALTQMLDNLVFNAAKHGGRDVRIGFGWRGGDGDTPGGALHVNDTGPGMPQEVVARITEPFVSGKPINNLTARSDNEGTGLGLSIVAKLAALHDATLDVDTAPGAGTTIAIRFPAARLPDGAGAAAQTAEAGESAT